MSLRDYIGVAGVTTRNEARMIIDLYVKFCKNNLKIDDYEMIVNDLSLGVLVSYKTLKNGMHPSNVRYPKLCEIPEILKEGKGKCFNVLHYNSRNPTFSDEIFDLLEYKNIFKEGLVQGIQLNISNPALSEIKKIKKKYSDLKIILQFRKPKQTDEELDRCIIEEYSSIDYILIDSSGGRGKKIDTEYASDIYRKLTKHRVNYRVGFAGGLNPNNLEEILYNLNYSIGNYFSFDAESGLRNEFNELDLKKVEEFFRYYSLHLNTHLKFKSDRLFCKSCFKKGED